MKKRKVNLVKDSDQNEENAIVVLGKDDIVLDPKQEERERKEMIKSLEGNAKLETLSVQKDARNILRENLHKFKGHLSMTDDAKDFSALMRTLADISGVNKKDNQGNVMVPIQINLDI